MFNKATASECSKDAPNNEWITDEKFRELFPEGYTDCNFFPSPIEYWAMSKEEICRNLKQTALLDLSSHLNSQKNLQRTFCIGHSSDTKLLTHLLDQNHMESIINSRINDNSRNNILNMPTDYKKECFTCNNVCKCSSLLLIRLNKQNKKTSPSFSNGQLVLPEVELINNLDKTSIKSTKKIFNYILNNEDISVNCIANPNVSVNYTEMLENISDGKDNESLNENNKLLYENNDIQLFNVDSPDDMDISTEQNIQDERVHTTTNEYNDFVNEVLKYFKLNSINDIFQDIEDDINMTM